MRIYAKLLGVSATATVLLDVPFLIWHGLSVSEVAGVGAMIALLGVFSAWSYAQRARLFGEFREEWRVFFAAFPATFGVILQALVVAGFSYYDSGSLLPETQKEKVMLVAGIAVFIVSLILPNRLLPFLTKDRA
ncbi:MAG TPA: hypothetical protein PK322_04510 [Opitutaceae bacterium]|nr:hypothetical protein [Opitutaceae bacterium]